MVFFEKIFVFLTKYTLFAEKKKFIWKNSSITKNFFTEKNAFTEKNITENVKNIYLTSEIYYYTENVCVSDEI